MSRALRELERDLAATRQTRAAVAAGAVVDMEDPDVHATDDAFLNRPTLFDDLARTEARDELAELARVLANPRLRHTRADKRLPQRAKRRLHRHVGARGRAARQRQERSGEAVPGEPAERGVGDAEVHEPRESKGA